MPSHSPSYPPVDKLSTQLSIPELLDFHLANNPDFPLYVFANDDSGSQTEVSMLEYIRAAHRAGAAIRANGSSQPGEIVAIVALLDAVVYSAIITGMMKVGLVPFPISTFLSPDAIAKMLQVNNVRRVITTNSTLPDFLASIREKLDPTYECVFEEAPGLSDLYSKLGKEKAEDDFSPLSDLPCLSDEDLAMCIHSSGSTGLPKAIRFTHRALKTLANSYLVRETRNWESPIRFSGFGLLLFHATGIGCYITSALSGPITVALFPPTVTKPNEVPIVATPENTVQHLERTKATASFIPPSFFSSFTRSEKAIEVLRKLVFVNTAGGFIPTTTGDHLVSSGVRLRVVFAGTEIGVPSLLSLEDLDPQDWNVFAFSKQTKVRWIPHGEGLFRCQFLTSDTYQPSVENLPNEKGYEGNDLFAPHPTKEGFWRIVGRIDDVIVQTNGQKTLPGPIEDAVLSSDLAQGAVVFGHQHVHLGVLIELSSGNEIDVNSNSQVERIREQIWPILDKTNKVLPQYSQICKEMILIASNDKPLPRAAKGTVNRAASLKLYEKEIEDIYTTAGLD
ncbi:hypothetical protein D9758_010220 [Tetrapyrgos nigripes]|uniref:AMP-dependent synthetase/ligase domain-containing protein n=1 Tax=Tetrapyrgos nigripes TaxID=182062 RepID=A0A8H5FUN4_9AGAR|nr:hypothetical protein D9758_010220 [Tetrapyrgos nigripes]